MTAEASVVEAVDEFVSVDDPWTSRREIRQKTRDGTGETLVTVSKREADTIVGKLVAGGELVYWHGLITLNEEQYLRAAIGKENQAEVTRRILVGKLEKILNGRWDFNEEIPKSASSDEEGR